MDEAAAVRLGSATPGTGRRRKWLLPMVLAASTLTPAGDAVAWAAPSAGDGCAPLSTPSAEVAEGLAVGADSQFLVGDVYVENRNVFDPSHPEEDRWLYRLANQLHRRTQVEVVCRQLLFRPGEPATGQLLAESERLLRGNRYLHDAEVRPLALRRAADGSERLDVAVVTQDVWTLDLGLGVGRAGGANTTHVQLRDTNLFGWGKDLALSRRTNVDRTETSLDYVDPAVLGSRLQLHLGWSDNSDGSRRFVLVEQPFYALSTRWAAGLRLADEERVDQLYGLGESFAAFGHQRRELEAWWGRSRGLAANGRVTRLRLGFTWTEDRYAVAAIAMPSPAKLPSDRVWGYPWVGVETTEDSFREQRDVDQMGRTEDLFLGRRASLRVGFASPATGADAAAAVLALDAQGGIEWGARTTLLYEANAAGRLTADGGENVTAGARVRWLRRNFGDHLLAAGLQVDTVSDLDGGAQLLLGGDSGLRGYPLRYQSGTSRVLFTLEQRFFTRWYPFRLLHVGAAVFADLGRTFGTADLAGSERGWLRDVGIGLRLAPSRGGRANVIHVDLAMPLDRADGIAGLQWLVRSRTSF